MSRKDRAIEMLNQSYQKSIQKRDKKTTHTHKHIYIEVVRFKRLSELKIYRTPGLSLMNFIFVSNFLQAISSDLMDKF